MDENSSLTAVNCVPINLTELLIIQIIQGIYGALSILLYIVNIRALLDRRNALDKVFSRLYITSATISIIYFLDHYCIQRFVGLGIWCKEILHVFGEPTWILNPYKSIATYCPIAILVLHFMISFNRFTLITFPINSPNIWRNHFFQILVTSLLIPLPFVWFVLPCRSYAMLNKEGGLDIEYEKVFTLSASLHSAIAAVLFGILTFLCTVFIGIKLFHINLKRLSSAEKTLIAFEALLMVTTMLYASTQALLYSSKYIFKNSAMQDVVMFFRNFIIDIFILPNAWTLPLLSQTVRRYYQKTLLPKSFKSGSAFQPTIAQETNK